MRSTERGLPVSPRPVCHLAVLQEIGIGSLVSAIFSSAHCAILNEPMIEPVTARTRLDVMACGHMDLRHVLVKPMPLSQHMSTGVVTRPCQSPVCQRSHQVPRRGVYGTVRYSTPHSLSAQRACTQYTLCRCRSGEAAPVAIKIEHHRAMRTLGQTSGPSQTLETLALGQGRQRKL